MADKELISALAALTAQVKRVADAMEREQKKSIIEQRKEALKAEKNELLSNLRGSRNGDAGRD
jgi:hypothetical protein